MYTHFMFLLTLTICSVAYPVRAQKNEMNYDAPVKIPLKYHLGDMQWADFDGDGKADLAGIIIDDKRSPGASYQAVGLRRNTGDRIIRLEAMEEYGGRTESGILRIWTEDVNGDAKPDVAVITHTGDMEVYLNKSTPGMLRFDRHTVDVMPDDFVALYDLAWADINGDGKTDMTAVYAVSKPGEPDQRVFAVMENVGDRGTIRFQATILPAPHELTKMAVGDMNGDGLPDLATYDEYDNGMAVWRNESTQRAIRFAVPEPMMPESSFSRMRCFDLDGDGDPDLMMLADDDLTVLRNENRDDRIRFSAPIKLSDDHMFTGLITPGMLADANGDGLPELTALDRKEILVVDNLSRPGDIRFNSRVHKLYFGITPGVIAFADLNGDGSPDLISITQPTESLDGEISVMIRTANER